MREPRSLLDFAIAASVVVVPVMLGIVLGFGAIGGASSDRYVSVRHVAALQTFEKAIVRRGATPSPAPTAQDVLAGIPLCRREWDARWGVAHWRPWGAPAASEAERIAARLAELDAALLRFGARPDARVEAPVGLDTARWFEAARGALAAPFETPQLPGHRFEVRCADIAGALAALSRGQGRMLDALAWRGTEVPARLARWQPEQMVQITERDVTRRNPWNGVPGCITLGAGAGGAPTHVVAAPNTVQARVCAAAPMAAASAAQPNVAVAGEPGPDTPPNDPRWSVPPSLQAMLRPLDTLRSPAGALYRLYTDPAAAPSDLPTGYRYGPNRVALDGAAVDVGFAVDLTIDPALQALAQKTAACYTGRQDLCRALSVARAEDAGQPIGHRLLESAMVRMAAIAVIDIASGRIEALAGAMSPCTRGEFDGPGRGAGCDTRLPYPMGYRPDALLNPAVFHDAMPASTIKPIMAAAFLADPVVGARSLAAEKAAMKPGAAPPHDSLRGQLMRSDSARFLDRMFCGDSR